MRWNWPRAWVLYVLLGLVSLVARFSSVGAAGVPAAVATLAAALAGVWMVGWLLRSSGYWRKIVVYARTGM